MSITRNDGGWQCGDPRLREGLPTEGQGGWSQACPGLRVKALFWAWPWPVQDGEFCCGFQPDSHSGDSSCMLVWPLHQQRTFSPKGSWASTEATASCGPQNPNSLSLVSDTTAAGPDLPQESSTAL